MVHLDPRCYKIVSHLLNSDKYMKVSELASLCDISKRSIYYDLVKINDCLRMNDIDEIEVVRPNGILLDALQRTLISSWLSQHEPQQVLSFSPSERISILICTLINRDKFYYMQDFMNLTHVSRNTVISDLKLVEQKLESHHLKLVFHRDQGYHVLGDTIQKRAVFFMLFDEISHYYKEGLLSTYYYKDLEENLNRLEEIEKQLETKYVSGTLYALAIFLEKMQQNSDVIDIEKLDLTKITPTKEYRLVSEFFQNLPKQEQVYLTLHLLGSRLQMTPIDNVSLEKDQEVYQLSISLIEEFSRIACVDFDNQEELLVSLFTHIKTSLYRYRYGISLGNPLLEDIKNRYAELFELTKKAVENWSKRQSLAIGESEIAYLTLHFGVAMRKQNKINNILRILIICPNGISTGNMLKSEVKMLIPHADIIDVDSIESILSKKDDYDFIISTIDLATEIPYLKVNPILTDADRIQIMHKSMHKKQKTNSDINALLRSLRPYLVAAGEDKVRKILYDFVEQDNHLISDVLAHSEKGLMDYLTLSVITYHASNFTWQECIFLAAQPLLDNHSIEARYVKAIVSMLREYGPYMFIADGVVLAHAKSDQGVNKMGISLGIFKDGVEFEQGKVAKLIFTLGTVPSVNHLTLLKDLMTIFREKNHVNEVLDCADAVEVMDCFKRILNDESNDCAK